MKYIAYSLWDRIMLSLPLILMALLALGTYWMVRTEPPMVVTDATKPVRHDPDYTMQGFMVKTYDPTGRMRSELHGESAYHYPDTLQTRIESVRIRSIDKEGRVTNATAMRGVTNQDSSEVQLIGNVIVVREADPNAMPKPKPRMEYRSEFLHAFMNTEFIKTDEPVELLRGKDRITADTLEFDNIEQVVQLRGRVRATLYPER